MVMDELASVSKIFVCMYVYRYVCALALWPLVASLPMHKLGRASRMICNGFRAAFCIIIASFPASQHLKHSQRMLSISVSEEQLGFNEPEWAKAGCLAMHSLGNPCSDCCYCPGGAIPSACCPVSPFGSAHTFGKAHLKVKVQQLVGIVSGSLPLGAVPAELSKTLAN